MKQDKRWIPILACAAAVLGIAWWVRRRRLAAGIPGEWLRALAREHGPVDARRLAAAICQERERLLAATAVPGNPALRWHLQENILPGLALYRVILREHNGSHAPALEEVDVIFRAKTLPRSRRITAPLKILPAPFRLFKFAFNLMMKNFPTEGWDFTYTADDNEKIAFTATRCFYLNTLTALGAPELTASFCKSDDVMAETFPPSIRFIRPHTLGRGDDLCDFQYCYQHTAQEAR